MKKLEKILIGVLILVVVVSVLAVVDRMVSFDSEVRANYANWGYYFFESRRSPNADVEPYENDYMQLQLEDLKQDDIFRYKNLRWNRTYLTLKANWAYELSPIALQYTEFRDLGCVISKNTRILDGIKGDTMFYFRSNGSFMEESELKGIAFRFEPEDAEWETWYQTQYEKLVQLYGQPHQTEDNQYRWEAGETALELVPQLLEGEKPAVIIRISTQ